MFLFSPSGEQYDMPVKAIESTTDRIIIDLGDGPVELLYLGLPGNSGSNQQRNGLVDGLNALMQTRQLLDDLPLDDPDRTIDPAVGERIFHERVGPNSFLVSQSVIVEDAVWDGEKWNLILRRAVG